MIGRRAFVAGVGSVLAGPLAAQAQRRIRRIGVLAQDLQPGLLETFRDELHRLGHIEGKDVAIELRNASGRNGQLPALAGDLLRLNVDVIVAVNTPAAQAAKKATATVPVVIMRVADPVKSGLVASLAHPGTNITGLSFMPDELGAKGIQLLREILPALTHVAALYDADNPGALIVVLETERRSAQLGLQFLRLPVRDHDDLVTAFRTAVRARTQAVFVMDDGAMTKRRKDVLALATTHSLPVVSIYKDFAESGGLIAYGPNLPFVYRRAAYYVDRILNGASAGDLPVEQPERFEVVVNLKTAKTLGLTIPQSVLFRADRVIQ